MEKKLIKHIDKYLEENVKDYVTIQVANKIAKNADLNPDNIPNLVGSLIKEGKLTHAIKLSGGKSNFVIPHSNQEIALKNRIIICQQCKNEILRKSTYLKKEYVQCDKCYHYTINPFFKGKRTQNYGLFIDYETYWNKMKSDDEVEPMDLSIKKKTKSIKNYTVTRPEPKAGTDTGCMLSTPIAIVFIIVGILLSVTGIGAIIGVPLIIAGIVAPFFSYPITKAMVSGNCPYCGHKIYAYKLLNPGVTCAACKKRVLVRDDKFIKVD